MALPDKAWALRVGYIKHLEQRGSISLVDFPGAPGVKIIKTSFRAIGIASRPKGKRRSWSRQDRHLGAGAILASRWIRLRNPDSIRLFEELEKSYGIENKWIEAGSDRLLPCYSHVQDLAYLFRMQHHIIEEDGRGYTQEKEQLEVGLTELQNLCLQLPEKPDEATKKTIALGLAQIEARFEFCLDQKKVDVVRTADELRQGIAKVYQLAQFGSQIEKMIEQLKARRDDVTQISPFIASRRQAAREQIRIYHHEFNSVIKFTYHHLDTFMSVRTAREIERLQSAFRARSQELKERILCQPLRTPARQSAARLESVARHWARDGRRALIDLKAARTYLSSPLNPTKT